ncbi:MAG: potassium-transporting ATPase subunit KdpA [Candidatus Eisenbacteria bacterium]
MNAYAAIQIALYFVGLAALAAPLGRYMARVYGGQAHLARRVLGPLEDLLYRWAGVRPAEEMTWQRYALCLLVFNLIGTIALYALQRFQSVLPPNPAGHGPVPPAIAFNTAVSFVTNTNWQAYGGETTMSHLTQALGLTAQNFVSAATGMAVAAALTRAFVREKTAGIGNFWADLVRSSLYILLPLSLVLALVLVSLGVTQTLAGTARVTLLEALAGPAGEPILEQTLALGPVASQVAIKQLGTNGGGFFNVNSAHPFENPVPFSNFLESLAILLIPAAFCFAFGAMVKSRTQGGVLFAVMIAILVPVVILGVQAEQGGNPILAELGVDQAAGPLQGGGNLEGKEVRCGAAQSAFWGALTTAASNGSVNAMHDSFMPLGGLGPLWLMQLGEVVFGGVGSGLYGMLMFAVIAVFVTGLMVGRTPEFLGKKMESFEMKMASLVVLLPAAAVLLGTAVACLTPVGRSAVSNPGAHGFSQILYAFSSGANNNGSAFAGLAAGSSFYATAIGICMLVGRYWVILPVLAVAGSLAGKKIVPPSAGTLSTTTPIFAFVLAVTVLLVGALTFIPALALGPVVEHLQLYP